MLRRMPIYEFHCGACAADSEILVRSLEWQGTRCPKCGSTKLEKKWSTFASSVAGSGAAAAGAGPESTRSAPARAQPEARIAN